MATRGRPGEVVRLGCWPKSYHAQQLPIADGKDIHMQISRVVTGAVGLALVGTLNVGLAGSAEAVPRPVPIKGVQPRPQVFYIKGVVGADFAGQKVVIQRKTRPGAKWKKWKKDKTSKIGKYKIRIYRVRGSAQTCYRVRVKAFGGFEKGTSRAKCVIRVY